MCKIFKFTHQLFIFMLLVSNSVSVLAQETLHILAWPGYADADLVQTFEERYKVKVEVTLIDSDDTMWKRMTAGEDVKFDVFAVNTAQLQRYIDVGISIPLTLSNIPNTKKQLPRFRNRAEIPGLIRNGYEYAIPYTYSEMGLIYDRKVFPIPPDSFALMWDKRFQGRVLMYENSEHNFSLAALTLGLKNPFHIPDTDFNRLSGYLVELRRNVRTYYEKPEEATTLFMQNNIALLFANYGSQQLTLLQDAGADIGYVIPKEGALAWLDCWSVTRFSKNVDLAESWINYTLEAQVSQALTLRQGLPNTLQDPPTLNKADKIIWLQQVENSLKRKLLWDKIMSGETLSEF
ncbi:extracellular solute-binding protein [Neptunomonas antarctica]|uniref:Putative spermidine/putrescine transport system substrate-binding protein n=1 Tax=Neptunomonas antarctica TaxID=619304 RepID=A0A1N7MW57_9GAMM|nr:extracellular solute-binding protein [Neptunomonas antarctica]SIS90322.1 putative spermidine/putrescine transport system substrate-binding protein [Neptunomonas antarctica]